MSNDPTPPAASFGHVLGWVMKMSWRASPGQTILRFAWTTLVNAFFCVTVILIAWTVDMVAAAWSTPALWPPLRRDLAFLTATWLTLTLLGCWIDSFLRWSANLSMRECIQKMIIRKSVALDLATIDSAGNEDMLYARSGLHYTSCGVMDACFLLYNMIFLGAALCVFAALTKPAALFLLLGIIATAVVRVVMQRWRRGNPYREFHKKWPRLNYLQHLLTEKHPAKEIRLFGLVPGLMAEHDSLWKELNPSGMRSYFGPRSLVYFTLTLAAWVFTAGFIFWMIQEAMAGRASLGIVCATIGLMPALLRIEKEIGVLESQVMSSACGIAAHEKFMAIPSRITADPSLPPVPRDLAPGIVFDNVSLTYPHKTEPSLKDVSITIRPGERVALVGENGSGKTTFVKVLTRLYDPTGGRVLVAGNNLQSFNVDAWRGRIGVIFQDFMRYHGSIAENVAYANLARKGDEGAIRAALDKAGAGGMIGGFPDGAATNVGAWYDKGTELSDGQWQRIALARAFFRDSDILVLDEPTSVLDARAEHDIFKRFLDLTAGKTTILISHRFSTVRMADTIHVFKQGSIIESGSHRDLMEMGGLYAELFSMQAEGYLLDRRSHERNPGLPVSGQTTPG